jgi:hypothetical protein
MQYSPGYTVSVGPGVSGAVRGDLLCLEFKGPSVCQFAGNSDRLAAVVARQVTKCSAAPCASGRPDRRQIFTTCGLNHKLWGPLYPTQRELLTSCPVKEKYDSI